MAWARTSRWEVDTGTEADMAMGMYLQVGGGHGHRSGHGHGHVPPGRRWTRAQKRT